MLKTEMRNPNTMHIDQMDTLTMVKTLHNENKRVFEAVDEATEHIAQAVDAAAAVLANGGRLIYVGAGTSGRLGVLDASECPPTFGVSPEQVIGLIAGGEIALTRSVEWAEDSEEAGAKDVSELLITREDVVCGISAAGGAAYVIGAMKKAQSAGAVTIGITCNKGSLIEQLADIAITADTGAEALTGSTRMKAGTAQKLILNLISTGAMIKTGKVYENLMINVRPVNNKLTDRCVRILCEITGVDQKRGEEELKKAEGVIRKAIENIKG